VQPHTPIVASVDTSNSATGSVQVLWEAGAGVQFLPVGDGSTVHVWAPPGVHSLRCDVFRVDWESKQFRVERHNASFQVGTPPEPEPQPEPVPPPQPVPVDEPGPLAAILPTGANRLKFAEFYRDLAASIERTESPLTTGQFREIQQQAVEQFKIERRLPDAPAINKPISDRIAATIGMDDRLMDAALKAELVAALRKIAEDF
jgi:hypothetical protein